MSDTLVLTKEDIFDEVGYFPHPGQWDIHRSMARHRVASCGRRYGKSQVGGNELTPEALATHAIQNNLIQDRKRREFWIVGPEYSDAEKEFRVFYDACVSMKIPFDKPGTYYDPRGGDMVVSLWNGRFLAIAKSARKMEQLVGEGLSGSLLVEAAKMKPIVWHKFIRPALADFRGWSLHTSTPEGRNWFYEVWKRGQDPNDPEWDSWRRPSWLNPYVFPEGRNDPEILDMAADMSEERFNQEVKAEFTDFVGRVFKSFDEEDHVFDIEYDRTRPLYVATDYGFTNPFVVLFIQVDTWGNVYIIDEYYRTNRDTSEVIRDIEGDPALRELAKKATAIYPEPAQPGDTQQLANSFKWRIMRNTGGEQKDRIEMIRKSLRMLPEHVPYEKRKPALRVSRRCEELIREMQDYRYPENKSEMRNDREKPLDKDDHAPEALGRFFRGYFGTPARAATGGRAKISNANVSGRKARR